MEATLPRGSSSWFRGTKRATFSERTLPTEASVGNIEDRASILSSTFLLYLDELFAMGSRRTLEAADLGRVSERDDCRLLHETFVKYHEEEKKKPLKDRSLWRPLLRTVGYHRLWWGVALFIISAGFSFGPVLLLTRLVRYFAGYSDLNTMEVWIMICLLFLCPLLASVAVVHSNIIMSHMGCQVRNILINVIYRKSLVVSSYSRQTVSTGRIITMFSDDTNQIRNFLYFVANTIGSPFQIAACLYLLFQQVGVATFVGLGYSLVILPFSGMVFAAVAGLRKHKMTITDVRVKLMNEILTGIRIIKYYAWEDAFIKYITETRSGEVVYLKKMGYLMNSTFALLLIGAPQVQTILIFFTYVSLGHSLDIATAFTTLTLFGMMTSPFIFLPYGLQMYAQCKVAITRIMYFLEEGELEPYIQILQHSSDRPSDTIVELSNATLSWAPKGINPEFTDAVDIKPKQAETALGFHEEYEACVQENGASTGYAAVSMEEEVGVARPTDTAVQPSAGIQRVTQSKTNQLHVLENINVRILKGQLVAVVGRVGCGKSSFLSALLGEMHLLEGSVAIAENLSFAYCDQRPFIVNATVRDNILFDRPFDELRFNEVLDVTCLTDDIKILANGVDTEIGERGVNLSGGA